MPKVVSKICFELRLITLLYLCNKKGDLASQEDDLVMDTEIDQAPKKCPITGKQIVNACKNTTCDHVYEREAIIAHMRGKRQVKCPYAGCTQFLNLN